VRHPDLNLLVAFDLLLTERSVAGAAARMGLSAPAMSRTLARIRESVGDPILVRAGKKLVPTARALELHEQVRQTAATAMRLLSPGKPEAFHALDRQFTLCAHDMFVATYSGSLLASLRSHAPKVALNFTAETELDRESLREGRADIWIGAWTPLHPEIRVQTLFSTRFVGLAREDHPIFEGDITPERFCAYDQIEVAQHSAGATEIDERFAKLGLKRQIVLTIPTYLVARPPLLNSDFVMTVPETLTGRLAALFPGTRAFAIPVALEPFAVIQAWHPRVDKDAAHAWLRTTIFETCRARRSPPSTS
jgi:DNA-binding transcriptional LysR family regulator